MATEVTVRRIPFRRAALIIRSYHYTMKTPSISYAFGAIVDGELTAVCTFGIPPNKSMDETKHPWTIWELNRLCVVVPRKNLATILISRCVKLMPHPSLLVSYADTSVGHIGYIYQASNWLYTGLSRASGIWSYEINGQEIIHPRTLYDKYGTQELSKLEAMGLSVVRHEHEPKHRYFYPLAENRLQRRDMVRYIDEHFGIQSYPKGESQRYNIRDLIETKQSTSDRKGFFS